MQSTIQSNINQRIKGAGGCVKDRETERLVDNMCGDEKAAFYRELGLLSLAAG